MRGLSTIEQQLARVIVPRRTGQLLRSKMVELYIARRLASEVKKVDIWAAYLQTAYYGGGLQGYCSVRGAFQESCEPLRFRNACQIVACLKYPRPIEDRENWIVRHARRTSYIERRLSFGMIVVKERVADSVHGREPQGPIWCLIERIYWRVGREQFGSFKSTNRRLGL